MAVEEHPGGTGPAMNGANGEGGTDLSCEPQKGLEFDSSDDALKFYTSYANRMGFKVRAGQLYRSKIDGSVCTRRYVCSKEGYQISSRTGCLAQIRVQITESGKWVIDQVNKNHNHNLETGSENRTWTLQQIDAIPRNSFAEVPFRPRTNLLGGANDKPTSPFKRLRNEELEGQPGIEPYVGQEFNSSDEAQQFYKAYATYVGFRVRSGQLLRSKNDGSVYSRRFVCTKEGHQLSSRTDCPALMRVKINESGKWVIDYFNKEHNHNLEFESENHTPPLKQNDAIPINDAIPLNSFPAVPCKPRTMLIEPTYPSGLVNGDLFRIDNYPIPEGGRQNHIGSDWYSMLLDYFQSRQAEDTGFFYAVEIVNGNNMSIFWADGRSRYSCSLFGDVLVIDTSYRESDYSVPLATFVGVNHHKQPVLLGCALIADESEEAFTWLFRTWLRAMSGRQPLSVIADQDIAIQRAIAEVFPVTYHRFSLWQIKVKEQENTALMGDGFTKDYEKCVYQSLTIDECETTWNALLDKYGLKDNARLKEMYEKRASWVPLYLKGTFFAGIPINERADSFFGTLLNAQTPLTEFIPTYERVLEQRRREERNDDFDTSNLQPILRTKEPAEEQCRSLYTLTVFKIFQKELLQCYNYIGLKIYEEGGLSRYLVHMHGDDKENYVVTFIASSLSISCSCQMFEYEGILCRHALRVFQILELREVPSRYILHRWTRNAEGGVFPGVESCSSSQELKNLVLWSLRETASKYIDAGAASIENYKLAYEILREGRRTLGLSRYPKPADMGLMPSRLRDHTKSVPLPTNHFPYTLSRDRTLN